tara:strand:- start:115 stop:273 length:159 start_codon:yes stop_codon:yes gene_type:complete
MAEDKLKKQNVSREEGERKHLSSPPKDRMLRRPQRSKGGTTTQRAGRPVEPK